MCGVEFLRLQNTERTVASCDSARRFNEHDATPDLARPMRPSCSEAMIRIKRIYEPAGRADGRRILVERLWPRGVRKEALDADAWLKDVAPSTSLRKWFGHRVERWDEFRRRYRKELSANRESWSSILTASKRGTVTLLYSAHDPEHNAAVVLRQYLIERARARAPMSQRRNSRISPRG